MSYEQMMDVTQINIDDSVERIDRLNERLDAMEYSVIRMARRRAELKRALHYEAIVGTRETPFIDPSNIVVPTKTVVVDRELIEFALNEITKLSDAVAVVSARISNCNCNGDAVDTEIVPHLQRRIVPPDIMAAFDRLASGR